MANLDFSGVYLPPGGLRVDLEFVPAATSVIDAVLLAEGGSASAVISTSLRRGVFAELNAVSGLPSCGAFAVTVIDLALSGVCPAPVCDIGASIVLDACADARSAGPLSSMHASYNINVWRGPSSRQKDHWQPALQTSPASSGLFQSTARLRAMRKQPWEGAARLHAASGAGWEMPPSVRLHQSGSWDLASARHQAASVPFVDLRDVMQREVAAWGLAASVAIGVAAGHQDMLHLRGRVAAPHKLAVPMLALRGGRHQRALLRAVRDALAWGVGRLVAGPGIWVPFPVEPELPDYVGNPNLEFCLDIHQVTTDIDFAYPCGRPVIDEPDVIPILRTYIMTASVLLVRERDQLELPALSASVALDTGTATWGVDVVLPESVLSSLGPRELLRLTINGHAVLWLAEGWQRSRAFGGARTIRLSGRSVHAELDAPLWPAASGTVPAPTNARQLAEQALDLSGYSLDWRLPDWLVPVGAWSWEGMTPLARVARLAEAAGGSVFGDPAKRTLIARPQYSAAPWEWAGAIPALQLPDAALETLSESWDETPAINAVIASGERMGVTARVKRAGTAGDLLAPTILDPLLTHQDPARARGLNAIAGSGRVCKVQISLPLFDDAKLSLPGDLVSVTGADPFRAMVRGVRLSADRKGALVVRQTLDLERRA